MKNLHIKWKIMIWHSVVLFLIMIATFPIMYFLVSNHLYASAKDTLLNEAGQVTIALRLGEGMNEPDSNIDLAQTGTYIAVYSTDNIIISGRLPQNFERDSEPAFGDIYYSGTDSRKWIVLDRELFKNGRKTGWFRIVKSIDVIAGGLKYLRNTICVIIPVYTIFSALVMLSGGFISRALSPMKQITLAARQISQGDLTKRLNFESSRDEVGVLAETFDQMLDRLEDTIGREKRFSSDVSHELRTPVTAIIVNAEEGLSENKTPEEYRENLSAILLEGRKMNSVISQLLMMARSRDGNYKQDMEAIDLSALSRAIVEDVSERDGHNNVTVSAEIDDGIVMLFEQTLYMRLLYNLIDNAIKYNIPGGWVKVSLRKSERNVILSVADGGIGISEEDLPKIWNRFYKTDQSTINSSPGLGLSIVKWITEQFGGTVSVKSEIGKGSRFEARFSLDNTD